MELGKEEIALIQLSQDLKHLVELGLIEAYSDNITWRFRQVDFFKGKPFARQIGPRA